MKPLTTAHDSLDRISTPEELQLVVGVLIDLNRAEDVEMVRVFESNGTSAPELPDSWVNLSSNDEPSTASDSVELESLFTHSRERTN